jgi:hypothetical protein
MKKTLLLIFVVTVLTAPAQVFNGGGGAIQNTGNETFFSAGVSGLPSSLDSTFGIEEVQVDITHPSVNELYVYLQSPSGTLVELTDGASCKGANFTGTVFRNDQVTSITIGTAPYTGVFRPVGYFGRFNNGQPANGTWKLVVKDWLFGNGTGTVNSWSIKFSNSAPKPVILRSSNLPIVVVKTSNNQWFNDVTDIVVNFGIISNASGRNNATDPLNNFNGYANMHIRGSSSKNFEKQSYKIELTDNLGGLEINASLLGMPSESDWVLTAGYSDKTLMRNALSQKLFQDMGHYSPRTELVELIINNEYWGVYSLMEQPKRSSGRVDIAKLEPTDNVFPDVTGGYIIQINRSDDAGWFSMYPGISVSNPPSKFYYQFNYPNAKSITPQQQNYIKNVMDSFEVVMNSPLNVYSDPKVGYRKYIDVHSFIDFLILNEFSKNPDAYKLSTYLYKQKIVRGGKIFAGPVWDYDIAWHNCDYGNAFDENYWQLEQTNTTEPIPTWWESFMKDKAFQDELYCRWHTFRKTVLSNNAIMSYIDQTAAKLDEAQKRNFTQFPIIGADMFPNPQVQTGATYKGEVDDLKSWVLKRAAWLDAHVPGFCTNVGIEDIADAGGVTAYPNPFNQLVYVSYSSNGSASVKLEMLDILGNPAFAPTLTRVSAGEHVENIGTQSLPAGTYILRLTVNNHVYNKKIIKLQ